MDDQNNKKGYDDFFSSSSSSSSSEESKESLETHEAHTELNPNESKPAHYYSYGPVVSESSSTLPISTQVEQNDNNTAEQQENESNLQLRAFTANQGGARSGGWQVREQRRTSFKAIFLSFLAGVLTIGGLMYTADSRNWFTGNQAVATQSDNTSAGKTASLNGNNGLNSSRPDNIASLFQTASPAVVKIETFSKAQSRGSSLLDDPFFRQFFGEDSPETAPGQNGGELQPTGAGTGFFFESTGYILTNQHVIGEADEIKVTVQGHDKPFTAKLLGSSYELDLAVVKIEGEGDFPTLPLGSSDEIEIGDWVVAIGNPYGFDHTVTVGVLSAKERPINIQDQQGARNYKHLLQTDASINPGNSGGPLLNVKGEVVGINTAVSAQAQGIGFAIPTSTINEVLDSLKNNKEIPKQAAPFIGAELYPMTEEVAKELGLTEAEGSLVKSVYYNSPAYLADLKQFDVIIGLEGKKFATTEALIAEIQKRKIGEKTTFNIIRQGKKMDLVIEIGDKNKFGVE